MYLIITICAVIATFIGNYLLLVKFGNSLVHNFADGIQEMFINPTTKKAFGIIGSMGGNAKATGEIENKLAKGFIDKNYGMIKMLGEKVLGLDVDEMIEEYGAVNILNAIKNMAPSLGIDLSKMTPESLAKGLNIGGTSSSTTKSPFEGRDI